jgi:hypothetical protein
VSFRSFGLGFALIFALPAMEGAAQNVPFKTLVFLNGSCQRLVVPNTDLTTNCKPTIVNLLYRDGRSSFAFSDGDRAMISFSGMGQKVTGDSATQPVDHVTVSAAGGTDVRSEDANGACQFGNPYKGPALIRCTGKTKSGEFSALFQTDGAPPRVEEF